MHVYLNKIFLATVFFLSLMVLISCESIDNPSAPEGIADKDGGGSLYKAGPSANGQAMFPVEQLGGIQNFSFHARENQDGSITGSFQVKARDENFPGRMHGTIDCLTIDGNIATMSGVATHSTFEGWPEGTPIWFRVVDNGEGNNSDPDQFSDIYVLFNVVSCDVTLTNALFEIENGNVQVKP